MNMFSCKEVKEVVISLMGEQKVKDKIYVAGGIVPWILSGNDSGRKHGDIDIVVEKDDMGTVREFLRDKGYYKVEFDSMSFPFNVDQTDHGVEVLIKGIPVNFAPFEVSGNDITQRNFSIAELGGFNALLTATLKDISVEDYITDYKLDDGLEIGSYTVEVVRAAKEKSDREKDLVDLREIDRMGIDYERYSRVKPSVQDMKIDFIAEDLQV